MKGRMISVLLAVMVLGSAFAGGSGEKKAEGAKAGGKTLEFSMLSTIWSPFDAEHTLLEEVMKATHTKVNMEWSPVQDFDTKVNTLLSSGKLPDVILGANPIPLLNQGAIVALDEYLKKAAPNILAALKPADYPFIRNVNDGHIYSLSYAFDFPPVNSWMIRRDWLKKVNLNAPTNWDEWLAVWRAFRTRDPNGDGNPANEIPVTGEAWQLYEAFGIVASADKNFATLPGGGYSLIYEHPNYRLYLETMAQLYKEKLLDQEFATRVMAERYKMMDSNLGGSTLVAAEQAKLSTLVLRKTNPDATCVCIAPPKGPKGDQLIPARSKMNPRGVVTVAAEKAGKVEGIVSFFDWMYGEEGSRLMSYGVQGVHYDLSDGKPRLRAPYNESFVNARKNGLVFTVFPILWSRDSYMQILLMGKKYEELDEPTKIFYDGLFLNEPYFAVVPPTLVTDAYSKYGADIIPALKELQANAIAGRISVDQFYASYEKLKGQGLQKIIDQASSAWKLVNAQSR